ncbi:hypothetical protein C9374_014425 [Naegleria lovaniensis]|uniref:Pyrroloquinoline quinone-dependent pyranose dehydrogenase beta-propeller domain-containing protein n=1 Tax=Naegleria lovaniensis TaxID=51637 RepID=A0AA88GXW1_NAELO|nr:uncharacterized protein C9374_014425 [Naegleria lovaniensis]KAG2389025.1 hypothetical protein C9374_014425 [Naegleria lovaniensis]
MAFRILSRPSGWILRFISVLCFFTLFTILCVGVNISCHLSLAQDSLPINTLTFGPSVPVDLAQNRSVIRVLARIPNAREMDLYEKNSTHSYLFVASPGTGSIYILSLYHDTSRFNQTNTNMTSSPSGYVQLLSQDIIVNSLSNSPNGVAYDSSTDTLYVGEIATIYMVRNVIAKYESGQKSASMYQKIPIQSYDPNTWHGFKYIRIHKKRMYVPVGAPCNTCILTDLFGTMTSFELPKDVNNFTQPATKRVEATGLRNSVGFDFDPNNDSVMYFTDNGRDMMGNLIPGDEFNKLILNNEGDTNIKSFGFPYCHANGIVDPDMNPNESVMSCSNGNYVRPIVTLDAHVAALGTIFFRNSEALLWKQFMNVNRSVFIAEHGSWNRDPPFGYRVMMISDVKDEQKAPSGYSVFLEGWLTKGTTKYWGRPVDVRQLNKGPVASLFISDDYAGAIYVVEFDPLAKKNQGNVNGASSSEVSLIGRSCVMIALLLALLFFIQ